MQNENPIFQSSISSFHKQWPLGSWCEPGPFREPPWQPSSSRQLGLMPMRMMLLNSRNPLEVLELEAHGDSHRQTYQRCPGTCKQHTLDEQQSYMSLDDVVHDAEVDDVEREHENRRLE